MQKRLILGSSSPYRKTLLERLNLTFSCLSPDIDETAQPNESPIQLVARLAKEKAQAIINQNTDTHNSIIITSDQVACLNDQILGKPLTHDKAVHQLSLFSGQKVEFITSLHLTDTSNGHTFSSISHYCVYFRTLSEAEIIRYIELEQPLNCAGSFKCEGLGVALFEKMEGDDPNGLIGLPLISLCKGLRELGVNPLSV